MILLAPICRLITSLLLFVVGILLFSQIKSCRYFEPTPTATHIIDTHLMPDGKDTSFKMYSRRFFDHGYVQEAAKTYSPRRYMRSFFVLDFVFPFIYAFLFITWVTYWKCPHFYNTFKIAVIACVAFDLLENATFAYYLFRRSEHIDVLVAVFTTLKSILFILCLLFSLLTFVIETFINSFKTNTKLTDK
ncbi:MAG: hypothetical protein ICV66_08755 [Chitinophagaceae bacterium]|nr:hypothetical protein [Chitinophagaceae bacterium]